MAILRRSLSTFLMVVAFIALTALASINYNTSQEQKTKIEENAWYQKGKEVLGTVYSAVIILTDFNLTKNLGYGQKIKNKLSAVNFKNLSLGSFKTTDTASESNSDQNSDPDRETLADVNLSREVSDVSTNPAVEITKTPAGMSDETPTEATNAEISSETKNSFWSGLSNQLKKEWQGSSSDEVNTDFNDFLSYQKTATGAEMIFRLKNGQEYKLPLPFKFLSK
ncbi:MAG: hypothetical protein WC523_01685 [Patescibacteria group bacterium]|jgi:hypothetical protein